MKLVSWNVNGLRAVVTKGFEDIFKELDCDAMCLQEIKLQEGQIDLNFQGYTSYFDYAQKKGYSGTCIYTRSQVLSHKIGLDEEIHNEEGRVVTVEFKDFYLVNVYTPNSKDKLARLDYRMEWDDNFREYVNKLDEVKPVIICGDLNVAHKEIDLKNPKSNTRNAGFTIEERDKLTLLLESGFKDSFREVNGDVEGAYSWWSYRFNARKNNTGWRIDYFLVSDSIKDKIKDAKILPEIFGSDHCPIVLEMDFDE